ncbi:32742_t:CDS:2, partial [Gigaspora margarita]
MSEVPQEASENIQAPELAPSDKRITGRTEQLNLKVSREFKKKLKIMAAEEDCLTTEIMEKALECYEKHRKTIKPELKVKESFPEKLAVSTKEKLTNQSLNEQFFNTCSFYLEENATLCGKPIFDKKKQLCRSHNKQ